MKFHEAGAALCRPETDQPRFLTHGQNAGLFCLSYLARTQCVLGYLDRGRATIQRARAIAATRSQDPGHIHSCLNVAIHAVRVYHLCDDLEAERRLANETVEMARQNHYAYYEALGKCHLGWVAGAEGNLDEGIALLTDGLAALRQTGTSLSLPGFYVLLSQLYVRAGRLDEAMRVLEMAAGIEQSRMWDADIERVRGDILAGLGGGRGGVPVEPGHRAPSAGRAVHVQSGAQPGAPAAIARSAERGLRIARGVPGAAARRQRRRYGAPSPLDDERVGRSS